MRVRAGHGRLRVGLDALRSQLWPLPVLAVVIALAAGVALPDVDAAVAGDLPPDVARYFFGGGPEAARAVLGAIASSLITVTALTFSLTVVSLQLASSQFSPRLLRNFTADRTVHLTLALFLGTFTFALTVLRTVRADTGRLSGFVPQISVSLAFVLGIASIIALVLFLAHLAREIRADTVMTNVHRETSAAIARVFPERTGDAGDAMAGLPGALPDPSPGSVVGSTTVESTTVESTTSGFLLNIEPETLREAAEAQGAVIRIDREPGSSIVAGTPLAAVWPVDSGGALTEENLEALREAIAAAGTIGPERTVVQDVAFGLRQLTDVAARALSPAVNDPTTAVHVLGHLSALLCELAGRELGPRSLADDDGRIRVFLQQPDFSALLELAIGQPRRYGIGDPVVAARILDLLAEVAWCSSSPPSRLAVADQLTRIRQDMDRQPYVAAEQAQLEWRHRAATAALAGRWLRPDGTEGHPAE